MLSYINGWNHGNQKTRKRLLEGERAVVRARREPGRLPVHVRRRAPVAQEPARQQRRRRRSTVGDGVDPNRNYPNHFKYDNEGSSNITSSDTYRGTGPGLRGRDEGAEGAARPDRLLVPGQLSLRTASGCCTPRAGRSRRRPPTTRSTSPSPATSTSRRSPDFHPGLSSDVLYVTNGETTDYAHADRGTLAWTPELSEGCDGMRVRVPGRRGAGPGRVRAQPAVRAVGRRVGERSGRPEVVARHRDQAVLRQERRPVQGRPPGRRTSRSSTPTATRSRSRCWRSAASATSR